MSGLNKIIISDSHVCPPQNSIYMNYQLYSQFLWVWIGVGVAAFFYLLRQNAPYGRHIRPGWGSTLDNRLGWFLMEFPVVAVFLTVLLWEKRAVSTYVCVFSGCFLFHYLHRSIIFPLRLRTAGKRMPWIIVLSAICFNIVNGFFQGFNELVEVFLVQKYFVAFILVTIKSLFAFSNDEIIVITFCCSYIKKIGPALTGFDLLREYFLPFFVIVFHCYIVCKAIIRKKHFVDNTFRSISFQQSLLPVVIDRDRSIYLYGA